MKSAFWLAARFSPGSTTRKATFAPTWDSSSSKGQRPSRRDPRKPSPGHFHDVQAGIRVRAINQLIAVHEDISGLDDSRAPRTDVLHFSRRRRNERADLGRLVRVSDVEHAHARILVGCEDPLRTDEASGSVLMNIVRSEMRALRHVVDFRRRGHGGDADRIGWLPNVEQPGEFHAVGALILHSLVDDDEQVSIRPTGLPHTRSDERRPLRLAGTISRAD